MATTKRRKAPKNGKIEKVMHEFKAGTLRSGAGGPIVKSRKQAIAIAISEALKARREHRKRPSRKRA